MIIDNVVTRVIQVNIADSDLCQDSDFAGDLEDLRLGKVGLSPTTHQFQNQLQVKFYVSLDVFFATSWMFRKQATVSHRFTDSEIISLGARLRMDGIPVIDLRDVLIEVLHSSNNNTPPIHSANEKQTKTESKKPIHFFWENNRTVITSMLLTPG